MKFTFMFYVSGAARSSLAKSFLAHSRTDKIQKTEVQIVFRLARGITVSKNACFGGEDGESAKSEPRMEFTQKVSKCLSRCRDQLFR